MVESRDSIKQELAMDEAGKLQGLKQMQDMCEWLESAANVDFDWYAWVEQYEECPVDDYQELEGDHKALFVQMINDCPNFDACIDAWKQYSLITGSSICDCADLSISSIQADSNVYLSGTYKGHKITVLVNTSKHSVINGQTNILTLADDDTFNGMAVWVDGVLDFKSN